MTKTVLACVRPGTRWLIGYCVLFVCHLAAAEPQLTARAALLMDVESGEVLYAKDPHRQLAPASTTKILTALVIVEKLDPNSKVTVSASAADVVPSKVGLRPGEVLYVQDLLYGLMLKSGNDTAQVLAEAAGGSIAGFAELMNSRARSLGAKNSHFMNPHGLTQSGHYSTAYDLALIFRQGLKNPLFAELVQTRNATLRVENSTENGLRWIRVSNSNRLLKSYYGARGGKTGFTNAAQVCFVGAAERNGRRLIAVVLGSPSSAARWADAETLFEYGFTQYRPALEIAAKRRPATGHPG